MASATLQEIRNKTRVYWWVRAGGVRLGRTPLAERIAEVLRGDPARAVFGVERLAFEFTRRALAREEEPRGLLRQDGPVRLPRLPEAGLILAHAGLGLALGLHVLAPLGPRSPASAFDTALLKGLDLCRDNSEPAYLPVTQETIGLAARFSGPRFAGAVDASLRRLAPDLTPLFWHGAGRILYLLPAHFLPGGLARALDACRREPPREAERLDALAGLSFAVAMVNLRHPRVFASLLAKVAQESEESAAVTHGAVACLLARHHTTPADPAIPAFLNYRLADSVARAAWERRVGAPGAEALARLYPALRESGRLGDLTSFQPLAALWKAGR
jgi:hypothetical protein